MQKVNEFRNILRRFEQEIALLNEQQGCCGVTQTQCHALLAIQADKKLTLKQLANHLNLDKSTVSRTVENLVKQQLVNRDIPDTNRRITQISLSHAGLNVCDRINQYNNRVFSQIIKDIPTEDFDVFLSIFNTITNKLTKNSDG